MIYQQQYYEKTYANIFNQSGIPDRKICDDQIIQNKRILNIGGGIGSDIWYLVEGNSVFGLDYSLAGLKKGSRHGVMGVFGNLNSSTELPFEDGTFDIIICKDILEHVLQPLEIMQELYRILNDDGFVIVSVPNHFYATQRLRILLGKGIVWKSIGINHSKNYNSWNYMHIRFFTYDSFKRFIFHAGFEPEKWFWDFGTLAHYQNPDMWIEPQEMKIQDGHTLSFRGKIGIFIIKPLWKIINIIFPHIIRNKIVSLAPGIMCAGFYVRIRKHLVPE